MSTELRAATATVWLVKEVADDHGLGRNARAVFVNYAEKLVDVSRPFYGLATAAADIESELLTDRQRMDVMSALGDLRQRLDCRPLSFDRTPA